MIVSDTRFLIKSKLEDYNDRAIKNKYNRYIDKKYLKTLPRIINRNLVKYPIIFSMLEEENIIRCLIATNQKASNSFSFKIMDIFTILTYLLIIIIGSIILVYCAKK
jgi:hypothetical protein